jgi:hypothetical protein
MGPTGVKFTRPQMDHDARPPIFTSPAAVAAAPAPSSRRAPSSSSTTTASSGTSSKRLKGQLAVLDNVARMLIDMVRAAESRESLKGNEMVAEMVRGRILTDTV